MEKEIVDPVTGKITIISNGCHGCGGALKEIILEPVGGGGDFDIRQEGLNIGKSLSSRRNSSDCTRRNLIRITYVVYKLYTNT